MSEYFLNRGNTNLNDFDYDVSLGKIDGVSHVYKFGRGATVANKNVPIWDGSVNYIFPTTAGTVTPTSSDPLDANGSTGAWSVIVQGLDENWNPVSESILIGQTSTNTYIRVFRVSVDKCGTELFPYDATSVGNNIGTITITHQSTALPVAIILPSVGQTLMSIYTIPAGYHGLVTSAKTSTGKGKDVIGNLMMKDNLSTNSPWLTKGIRDIYQNTVGNIIKPPTYVDEKTDIVLSIKGALSGDYVSGTFQITLFKK
jgi:hypothetical protein